VRRLLLILAGMATFLGLAAAPAAAATSCSSATYRHSFDGAAGTVTVTATRPLCGGQSQSVTLVSYTAVDAHGRFIYDSATGKLTATDRSLTLRVAVPGCSTQVVAFFGTGVPTELTSTGAPAGLGSYAGGVGACTTTPAVAYTYACDGTFTATLANGSDATIPAVFLTGGRRIRLSPGRSTTVKVAKGRTLTVRDSSFTTHVASWQSPAAGCVATAPAQAPAIPAAQPTTAPAASASVTPTTATATATGTTGTGTAAATDPAYDTPAAYPTFPDKTAEASAVAGKTGMGAGSILLIALGLLMVGGGIAAITYLIRLNRRIA